MQPDYVGTSPIPPYDDGVGADDDHHDLDDDEDHAMIPKTVKVSKNSPCPYEVMVGNRSPCSVPPDLFLGGWQGRPGGIDLAKVLILHRC